MSRPTRPGQARAKRISVRPSSQARDTSQPAGQTADRAAPRRKTIIILEDNASFGGLLVALLREEGYRSLRAWDSREAASMARDRRPDLIVLDLALPYRDGVQVLHELRSQAETSKAPILVVSGNTLVLTPEDREVVVDVVVKPFEIERMLNVIRRAIGDPETELPDKQEFNYGFESSY